jgi:trehalose/maltose hydrolase-like predicted phosphorylase
MADRPLGLQFLKLSVEERNAEIKFEALLDAAGIGLEPLRLETDLTTWRTALSGQELAVASTATLNVDGDVLELDTNEPLKRSWTWTSDHGKTATFLRLVAFGRGGRGSERADDIARTALTRGRQAGWHGVIEAHEHSWAERWTCSDIKVDGDAQAQEALRFAIYHLNSAANPSDDHTSIGARALTGDSYLGHVFWDTEIYLLPFYTLTWPAAARALLMYRYHTLPGARKKAGGMGYRGALYAWESADTGEEATPARVIDPNGRVIDILCGIQEQHISADITYAVWQYWQATEDHEFLLEAGAEIVMETSRFWASRAKLEADGRYHIRGVIGPDEYHENIDDNAFTNVMARWNIERGLELVGLMRERWPERFRVLSDKLHLSAEELELWRDVGDRITTGFDPKTSLLEQFSGYFDLEDIDLSQYEGRTAPMDVILGRERTQKSQVLKQADVVALFVLLPELFDRDTQLANFRYYEPRCGHGSSLSCGFHALLAARLGDVELADRYFRKTAETDLGKMTDISVGGIRIAAQGALWQAAVLGFAGLILRADGLAFDPHLPKSWHGLSFRVQWRRRHVGVQIGYAGWMLSATLEDGEPMTIYVGGRPHELLPGRTVGISLNNMTPGAA